MGAGDQPDKASLIRQGLLIQARSECPSEKEFDANYAFGVLSQLAAMLTSADKNGREYAKDEIRRLVKLGKGE